MRGPYADYGLGGWRIPKDAVMLMSSYNAQTDSRNWSRSDEPTPRRVNQFWAERFLVFPASSAHIGIPSPAPDELPSHDRIGSIQSTTKSTIPEFSLKGRSTHWFPYGGGPRMCPGRQFAKQEIISTLAIMLTLFDIEPAEGTGIKAKNNMEGFGFGALWPDRNTPIRIGRRKF